MIRIPQGVDDWRLLTGQNIRHRRLWPWGYSIQKFVSTDEPRHRQVANLMISSDYGGEHPQSTHLIYCYLVVFSEGREWLSTIHSTRERLLPDRRRMAYKRLDDSHRQNALVPFLRAAADIDGHLVAVAVDKKKRWLSTIPGVDNDLQKGFGLKADWKPLALESMMRKVQLVAMLIALWAKPTGNVTWITDEDPFVANEQKHDDALLAAARMSAIYFNHPMGVLRLNTTRQDPELYEYEDLCAVPDLAAGMLSDAATRLSKGSVWKDKFRRELGSPLPLKASIIADWFWDQSMNLRKTFISIDVEGAQYGVRKIWMERDSVGEEQAYGEEGLGGRGR